MNWKYTLYKDRDTKTFHFDYDYEGRNLIICRQHEKRMFAMFSNHTSFHNYSLEKPKEERCFYEVILGKRSRKPYFDIDIDIRDFPDMNLEKSNNIVIRLVENIKEYLINEKIKILVFESHRKGKFSFHVIVDGVCLESDEDSKIFADKVLCDDMNLYIDSKVYNSVQQLRIVGSSKWQVENEKKLNFELSDNFFIPKELMNNTFAKNNYILQASLITNTSDCVKLKAFTEKSKKKSSTQRCIDSSDDVEDAMEILNKIYPNFEKRRIMELDGNILVELQSNQSYYCNVHKRYHEHENAFIIIKGHFKTIYFDCRRLEPHEKRLPEPIGHLKIQKKEYYKVIK